MKSSIQTMIEGYNANQHIQELKSFTGYNLSEQQFAQLIGRCRMYNFLPANMRNDIDPLLLSDTQLGAVVKDYYRHDSFCKGEDGNINLWRLYNLFTGANKTSYIDTFMDRCVSASHFVGELKRGLGGKNHNWYIN